MKILIAGDFCPRGRIEQYIDREDSTFITDEIKDIVQRHDFSVVNLEAPIVDGVGEKIQKHGPCLKTKSKSISILKRVGFKLVTLANNHILDYGAYGLMQTISTCKAQEMDFVGAGKNLTEARRIFYYKKNGRSIAVINCCEHEFSIATKQSAGANPLNPVRLYYDILHARQQAQTVLVIIHGGVELYQLPTPRMKELYRYLIEVGADAVINHHQHCFSGYEYYKDKPIVYGLGNFCFDGSNQKDCWYEGYMLSLNIEDKISLDLIPYCQCKDRPEVALLNADKRMDFHDRITALNKIISDDELLDRQYQQFMESTYRNYEVIVSPWSISYFVNWFMKGRLPNYFRKWKWVWLKNAVECESHRERFIHMINTKINKR
jgi:poly-gamma-glutamate synthesis protein (capsule biosynthesis protein)